MAVKTPKLADEAKPKVVIDPEGGFDTIVHANGLPLRRKRARVKVGGVYVTGDKASAAQVKQSVAKSADMLERLGRKIVQPGVQLTAARDIPLYSVDPSHPGRFLRKLNGRIEPGVLENGAFKVVD